MFPPALDAGNLAGKYDVLIFPDGAIPEAAGAGQESGRNLREDVIPPNLPAEYQDRVGSITVAKTVPQLRKKNLRYTSFMAGKSCIFARYTLNILQGLFHLSLNA